MTPQVPEEWVWLARIRRPQGRKGEVLAEILTDFPQKFSERRQLWLLHESAAATHGRRSSPSTLPESANRPREVRLNNHWLHKGAVVLHFEGVESISDAEKLAGCIVAIPRAERAPLAEDEVYIADLVGCLLIDVANPGTPAVVGEIKDVERDAGPVPILIVRGASGEILVPFAKGYLRTIDLPARRIEMALPEGLADLNSGA